MFDFEVWKTVILALGQPTIHGNDLLSASGLAGPLSFEEGVEEMVLEIEADLRGAQDRKHGYDV